MEVLDVTKLLTRADKSSYFIISLELFKRIFWYLNPTLWYYVRLIVTITQKGEFYDDPMILGKGLQKQEDIIGQHWPSTGYVSYKSYGSWTLSDNKVFLHISHPQIAHSIHKYDIKHTQITLSVNTICVGTPYILHTLLPNISEQEQQR